ARSMRTRVTRTFGFVIPDISNPLFAVIARTAKGTLQNMGYLLNLANSGDSVEREVKLITDFAERQCDGLIFVTNNESDVRMIEASPSVRLALVTPHRDRHLPIDKVMTHNARGM